MRWFEDIRTGAVTELGTHLFTADEIVRFARDYDPQPFHLSEEAGRASIFGGLAASGWHTTAIWRQLMTAHEAHERQAAGIDLAPPETPVTAGVEDLRWLKPTLVDDRIAYRLTIRDLKPSPTTPGWGLVIYRAEGFNQRDDLVFHLTGRALARLKLAPAAA